MSFAATTTASSLRSFARSRVVDRRSARAGSASRARARGALVVRASGVDPESLAILQQRLGQRIELEGQGAAQLNQTAGKLLGADGRAIDKDERKKVLKADEQAGQALEISYDPEGLFPEVDEVAASMLIDKKLKQQEIDLEKKEREAAERIRKFESGEKDTTINRICNQAANGVMQAVQDADRQARLASEERAARAEQQRA